ncbi:hypothetical protein AB0G15_14760 [Streptosporangium sp. NPDC023825]|uniref:hypothetical protein n=1 Tax=Streptosporangium sp. NPDC023825 TaxID=3154909 RepID=UPI00344A7C6A
MRRRLLALILGLSMMTGCGAGSETPGTAPETGPSREASAGVELAEASRAFALLGRLDKAWRDRDCATVGKLTTWAERALGGRACEATRNGRPAPARKSYTDVELYLPGVDGQDRWFVALAREPDPAYFLFIQEDGEWRLGAGPIPVLGEIREPTEGAVPADDPDTGVRARLVPQRYLTYLTDPAGVSGVTFPRGDPVRDLFDDLVRRPLSVRPDRLTADVRLLVGPQRALLMPTGGALVIHALEIEYRQRARQGRSSLARPLFGRADLRGFTGRTRAAKLTGTEVVLVATVIGGSGSKLATTGLRRGLATLTAD